MSIIKQLNGVVLDSIKDTIGVSDDITTLDANNLVSFGDQIKEADKLDMFFGRLYNKIVDTVFAVRSYEGDERKVLRDEYEYGAFVERVYFTAGDAITVENPEYHYNSDTNAWEQKSPYDLKATVTINAKIFGGEGTWALEYVIPGDQLHTCFTKPEKMAALVDGMYMSVENRYQTELESVSALADNTGIASALNAGNSRNLLAEYNAIYTDETLTAAEALKNANFLKYACMEIDRTSKNMQKMSVNFNEEGYETFTPKDKQVVEVLSEFESACRFYLYSDTFNYEFTKLGDNYVTVPYWQYQGDDIAFAFADTSKISIEHEDFAVEVTNPDGEITQSGIIAYVKDIDRTVLFFGKERRWSQPNPRSDCLNVGITIRKGYGTDKCMNGVVFYIAD